MTDSSRFSGPVRAVPSVAMTLLFVLVTAQVSGCGASDPPSGVAGPTLTPTLTTPTAAVPDALSGLLPADDPAYVEPGTEVTYDEGTTLVVEGDTIVYTAGDDRRTATVPDAPGDARLSSVRVQLGQAGNGYLVFQTGGGESGVQSLVVPDAGGGLSIAQPPEDVPFGFGYTEGLGGHLTWTTGDGALLLTRVSEGDAADNRFRVYRWEVTGPGEGGGPMNTKVDLVPTELGVGCFDPKKDTVTAC